MNDISTTPEGALITACALGALMLALILWRTSMSARARASERARIWGELKRPELQARAQRKADERASGERTQRRMRSSLMSAVALVALAATNLSAHATIIAMGRVGLHTLDTAISVVVVFEAFLAILGALSYWHMHHGTGFNWYEAGVWAMASLMGSIAAWGGGSPIFALWPLLAAVAWHVVITFGREHKTSALIVWCRMRLGKATTRDASALLTERMITRIVNHAYYANVSARKLMRTHHEHTYDRAWARADALGILTTEVRARIQTRLAARYAGARALAPEAVAHMNPWNERASMSARTNARAARPVSAPPAIMSDMSAHDSDDARALNAERALMSAHEKPVSAPADVDVIDVLTAHFKGPDTAKAWAVEFFRTNGQLPNRNHLAAAFGGSAGNCGKWMTPVRKELGLS